MYGLRVGRNGTLSGSQGSGSRPTGRGASPTTTSSRSGRSLFDRGATKLGEPVITPAEAQDYEADLARATRAERKAIRKLLKSIGAVPTVPGREGGEAPTEDESQAA
jgi:hypothetical protein